MPVDGLRAPRISWSPDWCSIRPDRRALLETMGLTAAREIMELPGVVVSGHVGRNVSRVRIGSTTAYFKREHRVRLRDRFRSWWAGFGWVSVSTREAMVLRRLDERDLPGPRWLAHGESNGRAFLLVEAADGVELRSLGSIGLELAEHLGRLIASMHAAGIDQPDLFAKHFLVDAGTGRVTILDWQRATVRGVVPWRNRIRALATLRATSPRLLFTPSTWQRILAGYAAGAGGTCRSFARSIELETVRRLRRRAVHRSRVAPVADQELVRIDGETVCAIPVVAAELDAPATIAELYNPANDGRMFRFRGARAGVLRVSRHRMPFGRWWAIVRGKVWRSPELREARLLFHLERYGIPAPKLLAYGQTAFGLRTAGSFVLSESPDMRPPTAADRDAIEALMARLHAAGCSVRAIGPAGEPFGMDGPNVAVADVWALQLTRNLSARRAQRELRRLTAYFRGLQ